MKSNGIPETDAEADLLRAYISKDALANLARIRDEEIAEHDKAKRIFDDACASYDAIKARMRRDRIALKKAEAAKKNYFSKPLFARTDTAREATWIAAYQDRLVATARGEAIRVETCAECGARQKMAEASYTP